MMERIQALDFQLGLEQCEDTFQVGSDQSNDARIDGAISPFRLPRGGTRW